MRYGLHNYGALIADRGRTHAYADSLKRLVTPGSVVVDIGTGTGIRALLAARLGARKVYAIEVHDEIQLGRAIASENRLDGRVEFIQASQLGFNSLKRRTSSCLGDPRRPHSSWHRRLVRLGRRSGGGLLELAAFQ
jgi:predicted RNA methylase